MLKYLMTVWFMNQERTRFRLRKAPLFLATLAAIGLMALAPLAYADLFVSSGDNGGANNILRYDEVTGEFLGEFIPPWQRGARPSQWLDLWAGRQSLRLQSGNR